MRAQGGVEGGLGGRVQRAGRLVQEGQPRRVQQQAQERHALLLAQRQLVAPLRLGVQAPHPLQQACARENLDSRLHLVQGGDNQGGKRRNIRRVALEGRDATRFYRCHVSARAVERMCACPCNRAQQCMGRSRRGAHLPGAPCRAARSAPSRSPPCCAPSPDTRRRCLHARAAHCAHPLGACVGALHAMPGEVDHRDPAGEPVHCAHLRGTAAGTAGTPGACRASAAGRTWTLRWGRRPCRRPWSTSLRTGQELKRCMRPGADWPSQHMNILVWLPAIALSRLDFPQPDGPTISRDCPSPNNRLSSCSNHGDEPDCLTCLSSS